MGFSATCAGCQKTLPLPRGAARATKGPLEMGFAYRFKIHRNGILKADVGHSRDSRLCPLKLII